MSDTPPLTRFAAALPDLATAGVFLTLWISPLALGDSGVRNAMLVMLVEFILIHASPFLGAVVFATDTSRATKFKAVAGFAAFYLLFILAWSLTFKAWWPVFAFAWLLLGKVAVVLDDTAPADKLQRMQSGWALACMAYLAGVFLTVLVPLPRLGITPDVLPALDLPGSGLWVSEPHTVIAFGTVYFGLLAWIKWRDMRLPATQMPNLRRPGR